MGCRKKRKEDDDDSSSDSLWDPGSENARRKKKQRCEVSERAGASKPASDDDGCQIVSEEQWRQASRKRKGGRVSTTKHKGLGLSLDGPARRTRGAMEQVELEQPAAKKQKQVAPPADESDYDDSMEEAAENEALPEGATERNQLGTKENIPVYIDFSNVQTTGVQGENIQTCSFGLKRDADPTAEQQDAKKQKKMTATELRKNKAASDEQQTTDHVSKKQKVDTTSCVEQTTEDSAEGKHQVGERKLKRNAPPAHRYPKRRKNEVVSLDNLDSAEEPETEPISQDKQDETIGTRESEPISQDKQDETIRTREGEDKQDEIITTRETLRETSEYKLAVEQEWASRQREIEKQSLEAKRQRKKEKAQQEVENRQKQRVADLREDQVMEEQASNLKEQIRSRVLSELKEIQVQCRSRATLLRRLGISGSLATEEEVNAAYKRAMVTFHPDRAPKDDLEVQVQAEEKFKLICHLKNILPTI